jgi:hypothetical protein
MASQGKCEKIGLRRSLRRRILRYARPRREPSTHFTAHEERIDATTNSSGRREHLNRAANPLFIDSGYDSISESRGSLRFTLDELSHLHAACEVSCAKCSRRRMQGESVGIVNRPGARSGAMIIEFSKLRSRVGALSRFSEGRYIKGTKAMNCIAPKYLKNLVA